MDKAYAEAEAVLDDDDARAARRSRVLAAVAQAAATPEAAAPAPRPAWRRGGGWLVAASVAGLSLFVATQIYTPASIEPPTPPAAPAPPARAVAEPPTPAEAASPPKLAPRAPASMPPPTTTLPADIARIAPSPATTDPRDVAKFAPPPPPVAQAPASPRAEAPASRPEKGVSEVVVTGSRIQSDEARPQARASSPGAAVEEMVVTRGRAAAKSASSPESLAERLRAAAAEGRTSEMAALLAKGIPIDAPDDDGETALMRAIQADQPTAAAFLRRRGASLDRKNDAGVSARDMATAIGDAELNRALGLGR